ncbi:uncharacterized protein IL334_004708 [Kwoniella shivajii]|uniref:BHLH domain-containing protein n=1 Tax=Kwoniella shivajii TaxID=564305 RepID=A0ABZ1D131_9TREE|nr:hypothetical protein IL334_004708 [Kwoniella shivajii]
MSNTTPFSTFNDRSIEYQDTSFNSTLSDDIFDSSFSFMNPDSSNMDYYIASPDAHQSPDPSNTESQNTTSNNNLEEIEVQDLNMGNKEDTDHNQNHHFSLSPLTMSDPHVIFSQPQANTDTSAGSYQYPPYAMTYESISALNHSHSHSTAIHPTYYHPYRSSATGDFSRSPRSPPRSPALSSSPHGSSFSNRLSFGIPTSVSPTLVSPHSIVGSQLSDTSPNHPYMYQLPLTYGTPLNSITNLANVSPTGPGLSMVAGFPCPMPPQQLQASPPTKGRPISRPRQPRANARKIIKQEEEDDDVSDVEEENIGSGLGLSAAANTHGDRVLVSSKREDIRRARIESEQRRRDELREGFRRLKEALPDTNQRASKVSLLDRSVLHIQSIESANRYLLGQVDEASRECAKLREMLHNELSLRQRTASNSPGSGSQSNRPH